MAVLNYSMAKPTEESFGRDETGMGCLEQMEGRSPEVLTLQDEQATKIKLQRSSYKAHQG